MRYRRHIERCSSALALWAAVVLSAVAQDAPPPPIPPGTEVLVRTTEAITSSTATTGQKFTVEVVADVVIDGQVRIPMGTRGQGTVVFARKKGGSGRPGALDLRVDSVDAPEGTIRLKSNDANRGTDRRRSGVAVGVAFGLIGSALVRGEDFMLPAGSELHAVVAVPRSTPAVVAESPPSSATEESSEPTTDAPVTPAPDTAAVEPGPVLPAPATTSPHEHQDPA